MTMMSNQILDQFYKKYGVLPFNYKNKNNEEKNECEDKEKENIKEVKKATSLTSEDVHGGEEATKDIKNSPNNANNGEQEKRNSNKEGETGENKNKGGNQESLKGLGNNKKENNIGNGVGTKEANGNGAGKGKESKNHLGNIKNDNEEELQKQGNSFSLKKHHSSSEIEELLNNRKSSSLNLNRQIKNEEEAADKMIKIIKQISKNHSGFNYLKSQEGSYDTNAIAKHLVSYKKHLIPKDKHKKSGAKTITFFIDTSMSMYLYENAIIKTISTLEKQGFKCILIGGGNGLWDEDVKDDCYGVRNTLESFGVGTVPKLCRLTLETSIKLCNSSEFSVIIADFDGLSDFVKLAQGCNKDKVPYFLSTEDRYSWNNPCEHDWVNPKYSSYDMSKVYDITYETLYEI